MSRVRLAISVGDPNGIGIEVVLKAATKIRGDWGEAFEPVLYGPRAAILQQSQDLGIELDFDVVDVAESSEGQQFYVEYGQIQAVAGELSMRSVKLAAEACINREADALVTAPISKEAIRLAGYSIPGHTEFLAAMTGAREFTMMMVDDSLRIGLVTSHIALAEVVQHISVEKIVSKIRSLVSSLNTDFDISTPRIAVLGLNPHAGEAGLMGSEELVVLIPAIEAAREDGITVDGPFPADGFFGMRQQNKYDAVLAMYHDQGLVPFKTLAFETGVNFTAGLSIVRTSPDHGTAFDIAGKGIASCTSMERAIKLAIKVAKNRAVDSI